MRRMVRRDTRKDSGKKDESSKEQTGIDKSKGKVLGERPRVFYCALMLWINVIIYIQSVCKLI